MVNNIAGKCQKELTGHQQRVDTIINANAMTNQDAEIAILPTDFAYDPQQKELLVSEYATIANRSMQHVYDVQEKLIEIKSENNITTSSRRSLSYYSISLYMTKD
jgi:ABC-type Fe3+/spermidine/putrescine transport system ATPase subunit